MGGKPCDSSKVDEKLVDEAKETIIFLHWGKRRLPILQLNTFPDDNCSQVKVFSSKLLAFTAIPMQCSSEQRDVSLQAEAPFNFHLPNPPP